MNQAGSSGKKHSGRLAAINRAITTSLNFTEVLDLIVENTAQLVEARVCALLLTDHQESLTIRAARGVAPDLIKEFSALMDEDVIKLLHRDFAVTDDEILVSVPIIAKSAVNGLLVIVRATPLDDEEEWQLSALADQAAIALQNARLYEMETAAAIRARDASEVARHHLAAIVESSDDAIISKDLNGVIKSWNAGAARIFGYTADEMIGQPVTVLIPPGLIDEEARILHRLREGQRVEHFETIRRRKNGTLLNVSLTISPIRNERGDLIGASKIARDITDRKRVETELAELLKRELQARAEAEQANRLKDEFLATLSHELRNPLNVVIGYSEILRRSKEVQDQPFVLKVADTIRRNALVQSRLVSDLLDLSRLQMGKLSINRQPVSLSTIISDGVETVREEAALKTISLLVEIESDTLVVDADPIRVGQIVWNLLNNAVKFTPKGGEVKARLGPRRGGVEIVVEDNGQGIAPEFLPYVFEIFRQADASSSRKQGGMGIGLALVKQLAELHGGSVSVESAGTGQGARFNVWLPLYQQAEPQLKSKTPADAATLSGKSILVVDDSVETIEMLRNLLTLEGAKVVTANSGAEALHLASEYDLDLIISDISMPEMDGYRMLRNLRRKSGESPVPALAVTGYGRTTDIERARAEGFAGHLTKPLDIERLLQTVRKLTGAGV